MFLQLSVRGSPVTSQILVTCYYETETILYASVCRNHLSLLVNSQKKKKNFKHANPPPPPHVSDVIGFIPHILTWEANQNPGHDHNKQVNNHYLQLHEINVKLTEVGNCSRQRITS